MYRRVVLTSPKQTTANVTISYYVRGAVLLAQYRRGLSGYDSTVTGAAEFTAAVFDDVVSLKTSASISANRVYEFVFDVSENQPKLETVKETSTIGIGITVYNENGVIVCSNTVNVSPENSPTVPNAPGEMTGVPGEEPGEMTSVPGEEPGEMAGETTDEPGAMI